MNENGNLSTKLPVFDGNNQNCQIIQMHVLFGAQDFLDLVNEGYAVLLENATDAQRNAQREEKRPEGVVLHPSVC